VKLVGSEIAVGSGGTKNVLDRYPTIAVVRSWAGASMRSPATSTSRNESSRWQPAGASKAATIAETTQVRRQDEIT